MSTSVPDRKEAAAAVVELEYYQFIEALIAFSMFIFKDPFLPSDIKVLSLGHTRSRRRDGVMA